MVRRKPRGVVKELGGVYSCRLVSQLLKQEVSIGDPPVSLTYILFTLSWFGVFINWDIG